MLIRWFYERRLLSSKNIDHLTVKVEKKIDRRIVKAKGFQVYEVENFRSLVKGDKFTDGAYTTAMLRTTYAESINPIAVPNAEWNVPAEVKLAKVLPPAKECW
ncbi:hypothetical protein DY000_02015715 [Brassica cretica]|uniref:Uncharacterized protein n=1 Tax=Brassica cretica TaxID=69181 RepID=A0ABQ7CWR9_BRACR|nr:hypothetical protein DY000_02015715 [Brassica cretica]